MNFSNALAIASVYSRFCLAAKETSGRVEKKCQLLSQAREVAVSGGLL